MNNWTTLTLIVLLFSTLRQVARLQPWERGGFTSSTTMGGGGFTTTLTTMGCGSYTTTSTMGAEGNSTSTIGSGTPAMEDSPRKSQLLSLVSMNFNTFQKSSSTAINLTEGNHTAVTTMPNIGGNNNTSTPGVTGNNTMAGVIHSSRGSTSSLAVAFKYDRHRCSICFKCFPWPKDLEIHMRIHTGEKPFVCPKCPYKSAQKGNLKRHVHFMHGMSINGN